MAAEPNDPLTKERLKKLVKSWKSSFANRNKAASVGGLFHVSLDDGPRGAWSSPPGR
jgi:hypothetical protein